MRPPRTLADWRAAIERTGATIRPEGKGFRFAPCPACGGGSRDSAWVRPGRAGVLAGCNGGCKLPALAGALFPTPGRRAPAPPPGGYARLDGARARNGAPESPTIDASDPPRGRGRADFPALAEGLAEGLTLEAGARRWISARGLDPERLAGCGWRSVEGPEARDTLRGALRESGAKWPGRIGARWLVIPLWDMDGRPVSVRARSLDGGPVLTLPGDRGRLYGLDAAGAPPGAVLHVVEGETDREALAMAGALAVIGLPGAGSLHEQAVALARRVEARGVGVWLDGDRAGRKAAAALAAKLAGVGVDSRRWRFPEGMDANSAWRADPEGLRAAIQSMEGTKWRQQQAA